MRSLGDLTEAADASTSRHFYRAADAFDNSVSATADMNFADGVAFLEQGAAEVTSSIDGLDGLYC